MGSGENGGSSTRHPNGAKLVHPPPGMFMTPSHNAFLREVGEILVGAATCDFPLKTTGNKNGLKSLDYANEIIRFFFTFFWVGDLF